MRQIEKHMLHAARTGVDFHSGNTSVKLVGHYGVRSTVRVYLHGNHLADVCYNSGLRAGTVLVDLDTLRRWPTPTTKSRLRALGVHVYTRDYTTYIGDAAVDDIDSRVAAVDSTLAF